MKGKHRRWRTILVLTLFVHMVLLPLAVVKVMANESPDPSQSEMVGLHPDPGGRQPGDKQGGGGGTGQGDDADPDGFGVNSPSPGSPSTAVEAVPAPRHDLSLVLRLWLILSHVFRI